ncbi:hypothetical protein GO755_34855 [Spirosoma sp. HMF4905]|uniref:Uncharacterized protein n=1 Tax=Spirosoma arboris TaxID=2682092 RepID=A0A7K1SN76_9BACT|nr:hypothetical protein [Spirosoma arboris]MVM35254.1 hypothetical protein [Spirosoma arboris]
MEKLFRYPAILVGVLVGILACRQEIHPLTPPKESPISTDCPGKPIEKNIIGTWHFKTFNRENKVRTGTVSFDAQKNIADPDSLFENRLDVGGVVTAKTYNTAATVPIPTDTNVYFAVYQLTKAGSATSYYNTVLNECNRIRLEFGNSNGEIGFELTRK